MTLLQPPCHPQARQLHWRGDTCLYLDDTAPLLAEVGYGSLGTHGELGYEGGMVSVVGRIWDHALSAHGPSRVLYDLGGRYAVFTTRVALNDTTPAGASQAEFTVWGDGSLLAYASVTGGDSPQELSADVTGIERLELKVHAVRFDYCHSVWLEPSVLALADSSQTIVSDCLERLRVRSLPLKLASTRCIASVVSPGYEDLLGAMLGSLFANGHCVDLPVVVFAVDADEACARVIARYGAHPIFCQSCVPKNPTLKAVLYSVAHVVDASAFLCLDADTLVMGDITPLFSALDALPDDRILVCRHAHGGPHASLGSRIMEGYGGRPEDIDFLVGHDAAHVKDYRLVVNDGIFAARRTALIPLDAYVRSLLPRSVEWVGLHGYRNEFVFNLALAVLDCGAELSREYNVQLFAWDLDIREDEGGYSVDFDGRPARILHFSGAGRDRYPELRARYSQLPEPAAKAGGGDTYSLFLEALSAWITRFGQAALAWSFYGTADSFGARVPDTTTFPLFAFLHYLLRSNGCRRVLETGTGRGVSTACMASAVCHRDGAVVVTFDPYVEPMREALWASLPEGMAACITARACGSLEGMREYIESGQRFDAVLLDSLHTAEQVWAEFELATELTCEGGLILIHDIYLPAGTVGEAVRRIEEEGYGVVRLWGAQDGYAEAERLGLAVIENTRKAARRILQP